LHLTEKGLEYVTTRKHSVASDPCQISKEDYYYYCFVLTIFESGY